MCLRTQQLSTLGIAGARVQGVHEIGPLRKDICVGAHSSHSTSNVEALIRKGFWVTIVLHIFIVEAITYDFCQAHIVN